MNASILHEIDALRQQSTGKLKVKYREVFGEDTGSNHKQFLIRRIAWRLQANAQGDLPERARRRALALAQDADLRISAPQNFPRPASRNQPMSSRDVRLPPPGTVIQRPFQGQAVEIEVLAKGFRYQDRVFRSLSAIARHVTGTQWNGFLFFGLNRSSAGGDRGCA